MKTATNTPPNFPAVAAPEGSEPTSFGEDLPCGAEIPAAPFFAVDPARIAPQTREAMRRIRSVTAWLSDAGVDVIAIQKIAPTPVLQVRHSFSVDFWIGHNKRFHWRLITRSHTVTNYSAEVRGCLVRWNEHEGPPAAALAPH